MKGVCLCRELKIPQRRSVHPCSNLRPTRVVLVSPSSIILTEALEDVRDMRPHSLSVSYHDQVLFPLCLLLLVTQS